LNERRLDYQQAIVLSYTLIQYETEFRNEEISFNCSISVPNGVCIILLKQSGVHHSNETFCFERTLPGNTSIILDLELGE